MKCERQGRRRFEKGDIVCKRVQAREEREGKCGVEG